MKEIKHIVENIREELDGAEKYAKIAAKMKADNPTDASVYADMARQELGHVDNLHKMAVRAIEKYRATGATVPTAMQAVWDWEHEMMMDKVAHIKTLLSMA
jgi:rubrerythrin